MKKIILISMVLFWAFSAQAQTEELLIGKWKLEKWTKKGEEQDIVSKFKTDEVYQVFEGDAKFKSLIGDKETKGSWKLSKDEKSLTISVMVVKAKFDIEYIDDKKRVISSKQGTFEYKKVED
ncbi:hypothetical protein IFO69_14320 [Echinicola sp. CAU 1574]|uniref:Lipocalin-like domain-containing protein n=1 Tax=Echinicola arenosa TaxID=2774144 RepID=A0ABR9AM97_9BACT|nr:lipocalin family protein [Echinicola arenosa]MBD8489928.1 hypothetical protein [Echinicola arenosa]